MGENIIIADVNTIKELAGAFGDFKTDIETATTKLTDLKIAAGDFTDADELETLFNKRTGELTTNLKGLSDTLGVIKDNLQYIAENYEGTEKLNELTAKDLEGMIEGIEKYLPGYK